MRTPTAIPYNLPSCGGWPQALSRRRPTRGGGVMECEQIVAMIETGLGEAEVRVSSDDGTHFDAVVVAAAFEGQSRLRRHQLVYAALGPSMGREIHAMSIKAYTPEEWRQARAAG
jgi:acid stress-induced BolA-like protein IbaG/YrbA